MAELYAERYGRWKRIILLSLLSLAACAMLSLHVGPTKIPPLRIAQILLFEANPLIRGGGGIEGTILIKVRLPRTAASVLVGGALAAAGAVFQGIFRNPMADPYVIGVSSGAALGAAVAIVLGLGVKAFGGASISIMAFLGALLSLAIVYRVSKVGSSVPITTLLLAGISVSIFLSAIVALLEVMAGTELHALVFWLMGGFSYARWKEVWAMLPSLIVGLPLLIAFSKDLNVLTLGEEEARHLGVDVEKAKKAFIAAGAFMTALSVSTSGLIGFVGLIVPHLTRILVGPDHRILIPASWIFGASFLTLSDSLARILLAPSEVPVGIITALFGGPFFIYLLRKRGEYAA
ncbi:TPA: iron ABC transporter permease [Candidatus Bathyarchaeota archaeon]|nr:iron ABC transporter permease [Candidatus Bathyarchaeota archaeon]